MNGLIRANILAKTGLMKPYFASDVQLVGELSLYGKFVEIPEYLFFRRIGPTSTLNLKNEQEHAAFHDPDRHTLMLFQNWKLHLDYLASAWRAPMELQEKLCVYGHLMRECLWARTELWQDLWTAAQELTKHLATRSRDSRIEK